MMQSKEMSRRSFLGAAAAGAALVGVGGARLARAEAEDVLSQARGSRPNMIFILADDMGYNDLSIMGQENFVTPNLDRMAEEGMIFTDHYCGSTVCAPSRATLLTGNHTGRVYQRGNGDIEFRRDPHDITIATRLQDAGYHTAMIGKSGLACHSDDADLPNDKGFDHFFGFLDHRDAHRYFPPELVRNGERITYPGNHGSEGEIYSGDLLLDDTLTYIDQRGQEDAPFFLHLALQQPHADMVAPQEFRMPYVGQFEEEPYPEDRHYYPQTHPAATYAAMITYVDHTVRRVLQKLRELGIEEDTLVMFSSDNGSHAEGGYHYNIHDSNAPFRGGKRDLYEGAIRMPTLAWWPGMIPAGTRTDHISAFWDFPATALELAGESVPEEMDGISFVPVLVGREDEQEEHEYLYWEFYEFGGRQAVRHKKWKGVRLNVSEDRHGPLELYDLEEDPEESNNIADNHPDIVEKLAEFMEDAHEPPESELFSF